MAEEAALNINALQEPWKGEGSHPDRTDFKCLVWTERPLSALCTGGGEVIIYANLLQEARF